ncbi:MAG: Mov34/MPN/PAD-1 family protein [Candidatus Heimdallarchaeaceae archaeon]
MGNSPSDNKENSLKSRNHENSKSSGEKRFLRSVVDSITVPKQMIIQMTEYSLKVIPKEAIGLLAGREIRKNELILNKVVYVTSGDEVSVSFADEDFEAFDKILHQDSYCIGWWHSHPGYGLFLSQTDIHTQIYSFQLHNEKAVALVLDPTTLENGVAAFKCFQVVKESNKETFITQEIASYIR